MPSLVALLSKAVGVLVVVLNCVLQRFMTGNTKQETV